MHNRPSSKLQLEQSEIDILLKFFPLGICAFDLEMTGLSPIFDKIIEIAAIKIKPNGESETYHSFVNPLITIPEETIQYHGLTNKDLANAPSLKTPLSEFVVFFENLPLVAHSAQFDVGFIIRGMHQYNITPGLSDIYDSCRSSRNLLKKNELAPTSFKLSDLATYYDIKFDHHKALDDAIVCIKIFAKSLEYMTKNLPSENIKNLGFLFKLNSFKKSTDYLLPNKLKKIENFLPAQKPFYIKYKGGSFKGKFRPIKPIALMPLPQGLILYAECIQSKMNKYFKVSKIQAISEHFKDE